MFPKIYIARETAIVKLPGICWSLIRILYAASSRKYLKLIGRFQNYGNRVVEICFAGLQTVKTVK